MKGKMNEFPKDNDAKSNSVIKEKSASSSLAKKENQYKPPTTSEELKSILEEYIRKKDLKNFRDVLSKHQNLLKKDTVKDIIELFYCFDKDDQIYCFPLIKCLIEYINDPNIVLDKDKNKKSLLMLFCEKSNIKIITNLFEKKIELDVNYEDTMKRNSLFYLKGGDNDRNIIEFLAKKGINMNHKDNDGNTALHYFAINNANIKIIYNLIDIGNANFMIKNKKNITSLELINLNLISKKNIDTNNKANIFNFIEINKLIQLIKNKLSLQSINSNSQKNTENNFSPQSQNLFKIPSIIFNKNNYNETTKNSEENDFYLLLKKNPSLIINTQFNDKNNNNLSFSQKMVYYKQVNKNKKTFLNFLKNSENYLVEKAKIIKASLEEKKKELKNKENELHLKEKIFKEKNDEFNDSINKTNLEINQINTNIKNVVNEISQKDFKYLVQMNYIFNKFHKITNQKMLDYRKYIWNQLTIDLRDYCFYVNAKNQQLNQAINEIYEILGKSVKECLGNDYEVKIYGSRATGMCLPWSDIDLVIAGPSHINELYTPLEILNSYLDKNSAFEDIKYISTTQVPIIKIKTNQKYQNLALDISVELPSHQGQNCVKYIIAKTYEYPTLVAMTLALKTIFYKAQLNDPYKGGLSSYGIILLIIYFLNLKKKEGEDISIINIGKLFFELLLFYQDKENVKKPINVNDNYIASPGYQWMEEENSLRIIDPLDYSNNVAKNVRQLNKILHAFIISVKSLFESCECGCHYQNIYCIREEKCNHNLLNNLFSAVKRETSF